MTITEEHVYLLRQTLDLLDDPNASEFDADMLAWKIRTALSLPPVDEMLSRIYGDAA